MERGMLTDKIAGGLFRLSWHVNLSKWTGLVPSCCVIFDLESLSTSFDFVFSSEIFKPLSLRSLSSFLSCDLVSWYRHAHHLESLLTISLNNLCLDNLDIFKEDLENQSL
ncbi:hypothetical protein Tco_0356271 [Tanacetum coccineum]